MTTPKKEENITNKSDRLTAKQLVSAFHNDLEATTGDKGILSILDTYTTQEDYRLRSVYPFREVLGTSKIANTFWKPLKQSFTKLQRRPDIFIAGKNSLKTTNSIWVLSMGHFLGLFDKDWLGIRHTRQLTTLRYAEFNHVCLEKKKIVETGLFLDIVGLMQAVGMNPLPPSAGTFLTTYPGPRTHDGLFLTHDAPDDEGDKTQSVVDQMIDDLSKLNKSLDGSDPSEMRRTWHDDMLWYGPAGIGATYTIPRYQEQHQRPFRSQLGSKKFHGHLVRIAEGSYAAFFGWPMNLTNMPLGGFMGLPASKPDSPMQVVDVYRREGDKLAENWVFIDLVWYLKHQGLDILERTCGILNPCSVQNEDSAKKFIEKESVNLKNCNHIENGAININELEQQDRHIFQ